MNKISKIVLFFAASLFSCQSLFCKLITNTAKKDQPSTTRSKKRLIGPLRTAQDTCAARVDCAHKNKPSRARSDVRLVLPIDTQMAYPLRGGF